MTRSAAAFDRSSEPVLDAHDIQANIVPGFLKPFMIVEVFEISDAGMARNWFRAIAPRVTTTAAAMVSRTAVRRQRVHSPRRELLNDVPAEVDDLWTSVSISYSGMQTLFAGDDQRTAELGAFDDEGFTYGMAARSGLLGDPAGSAAGWKVGGSSPAHVMVVLAGDTADRVSAWADEVVDVAARCSMTLRYRENAFKLNPTGAEHFGFKDGVSQPGVRGRINADPDSFVTPSVLADGNVPEAALFGLPGQHLLWPGEFVFGYPACGADPLVPGPINQPGPSWSRNGSYLAFRRLTQDVDLFQEFVATRAATLQQQPGWSDWDADKLASAIVGRWPSGAPVSRIADTDDPALGADRIENNDFGYGVDSDAATLKNGQPRGDYPLATSDPIGLQCPLVSHIRTVNTRQTPNDRGGNRATYKRRILRRGLPFGAVGDPEVGLLFLSYQASLVDQFELLVAGWMNDPANPRMPSGHDMLIGQNGQPGQNRARQAVVLNDTGSAAQLDAPAQWVTATGGEYFFTPSISALVTVFGATAS